jgi:hypothetical protein
MKSIDTTLMLGLVLFVSATLSLADEPNPSYEHLKSLDWFIGDWRADFVIEDIPEHAHAGEKAVSLASYKWVADKGFIQSDFTDLVNGEVVGTGHEVTLWNYRKSRIEQTFIVSTQFSGAGVWAQDGNKYTLEWRGDGPDGTSFEGVSHMVHVDDNTYTWEVKDVKRNGESIPDWPKRTYHRILPADHQEAYEAFANFMVGGKWTQTVNGQKCEHEYTRTLGGKFVRSAAHVDPEPWDGFFGIDPKNNRLGWWGFFADGAAGVCHLTKATDTEWKFEGDAYSLKGAVRRKLLVKRTGPDQLLSRIKDSLNGEAQPVVETTWTRKR